VWQMAMTDQAGKVPRRAQSPGRFVFVMSRLVKLQVSSAVTGGVWSDLRIEEYASLVRAL
jgi:hypothetical protein